MAILSDAEILIALGTSVLDDLAKLVYTPVEHLVFNYLRYNPVQRTNVEYYPINPVDGGESGVMLVDSRNGRAVLTPASYIYGDILALKNRPAWNDSTLEVREDFGAMAGQKSGSFGTPTILTKGVDYWMDVDDTTGFSKSGILYRVGGSWATEPGSIKVTYKGGYTASQLSGAAADSSLVSDIKLATAMALVWNYKQLKLNQRVSPTVGFTPGPITSESIGPYSYSASGGALFTFSAALPASVHQILQPHRYYGGTR